MLFFCWAEKDVQPRGPATETRFLPVTVGTPRRRPPPLATWLCSGLRKWRRMRALHTCVLLALSTTAGAARLALRSVSPAACDADTCANDCMAELDVTVSAGSITISPTSSQVGLCECPSSTGTVDNGEASGRIVSLSCGPLARFQCEQRAPSETHFDRRGLGCTLGRARRYPDHQPAGPRRCHPRPQ